MGNYLCSNAKLEEIPWNDNEPEFTISESDYNGNIIEYVKPRTNKKYVYEIDSFQGCGCGFCSRRDYLDEKILDTDERNKNINDINKLVQYLHRMLKLDIDLKIYVCWIGDEYVDIVKEVNLKLENIDINNFEFEENCIYHIS